MKRFYEQKCKKKKPQYSRIYNVNVNTQLHHIIFFLYKEDIITTDNCTTEPNSSIIYINMHLKSLNSELFRTCNSIDIHILRYSTNLCTFQKDILFFHKQPLGLHLQQKI